MTDLFEIIGLPVPHIQIVDVGAMSEGEERYQPLLAAGIADVTGFEPNPEQFAKLCGRSGPYRYLPVVLGNGSQATFKITRYPGCSSLLEPDPAFIEPFHTLSCRCPDGHMSVERREPVETTRLDDLKLRAHLLTLDTQGSELEILRHGTATLADTLVIETEVEFVPLYKDQPLFGDVQCFLRDQGFVLHKMMQIAGRAFRPLRLPNEALGISQWLWADAVFVRDFTRLQCYGDDALLRAATILDAVYGSFDLAALLLAEHDQRHAGTRQARYLDSLRTRQLQMSFVTVRDRF